MADWKCSECGWSKESRCKPKKCPECGSSSFSKDAAPEKECQGT